MCTQEKVIPIPLLEIQIITHRIQVITHRQEVLHQWIIQQEVLLQGVQQTEAAPEVLHLQEEIN